MLSIKIVLTAVYVVKWVIFIFLRQFVLERGYPSKGGKGKVDFKAVSFKWNFFSEKFYLHILEELSFL